MSFRVRYKNKNLVNKLPQKKNILPSQVVNISSPLQQDQLRKDGYSFQVQGECPHYLITQTSQKYKGK